jgi:ferrous iron transport protein B
LFKKTVLKGASANYLMELPEYRVPTFKNTFLHTWERVKGFLIKAGTVLLAAFVIIWFLSYFGVVDGTFRLLADAEIKYSLLGIVGKFLLPIFKPIGFSSWQATVAILTGFVAKESVVGTLGILYGVTGDVLENGSLLYASIQSVFTPLQAYAFMTFALLSAPCIAALAAMNKELGSKKWFFFALTYEMVVAYLAAFLIFQIGSMSLGNALSLVFGGVMILIVFASIRRIIKRKGNTCGSCSECVVKNGCSPKEKKQ